MTLRNVGTSASRILWSRFLTHSGDQAWDFTVPLALVSLLPGGLSSVAFYFLLVRLGHMLLVPKVCTQMDEWDRLFSIKIGIGVQTFGVVLAIGALEYLNSNFRGIDHMWSSFFLRFRFF